MSFTLTYITVKIPNFAHSVYVGIGVYVSYTFAKIMHYSPYLGFPVAFLVGGVISVIVFQFVVQPIVRMGGGRVTLTVSTIAVQIFLIAFLDIYTYWLRVKYQQYTALFMLKGEDFKFGGYPGILIVSVVFCVTVIIFLYRLLTKTNIGIAMMATAEDKELASILGININRVQMIAWFLTGGLACISGAMLPFWFVSTTTLGGTMMTSIMAGSLLGGLNNVYGAIIGGFGIGITEIIGTRFLQGVWGVWVGEYRSIIPMLILVVILLIEPRGLQPIYDKIKNIYEIWGKNK